MIKKYNQLFENQDDLDWEEEPDDTPMNIIGWRGWDEYHTASYVYILQDPLEPIKGDIHFVGGLTPRKAVLAMDRTEILTEENLIRSLREDELQNYIYNDKVGINVYEKTKGWIRILWSELPQNIKNLL